MSDKIKRLSIVTDDYEKLLKNVDSVYIRSSVEEHYEKIHKALSEGKHVLCESPICEDKEKCQELISLAKEKNLVLMEAIRTAYSTAYSRLLLLLKSGKIGNIISVDVTCTSLKSWTNNENKAYSLKDWGSNAMLPVFQILGTNYKDYKIISHFIDKEKKQDGFTKIDFIYDNAVASIKVAERAKSEGELIVTGTEGYIYVPAPWWKTDYFEIRYEDPNSNKRLFYQLDGEGIRNELVAFTRAVQNNKNVSYIEEEVSIEFCNMINNFNKKINLIEI